MFLKKYIVGYTFFIVLLVSCSSDDGANVNTDVDLGDEILVARGPSLVTINSITGIKTDFFRYATNDDFNNGNFHSIAPSTFIKDSNKVYVQSVNSLFPDESDNQILELDLETRFVSRHNLQVEDAVLNISDSDSSMIQDDNFLYCLAKNPDFFDSFNVVVRINKMDYSADIYFDDFQLNPQNSEKVISLIAVANDHIYYTDNLQRLVKVNVTTSQKTILHNESNSPRRIRNISLIDPNQDQFVCVNTTSNNSTQFSFSFFSNNTFNDILASSFPVTATNSFYSMAADTNNLIYYNDETNEYYISARIFEFDESIYYIPQSSILKFNLTEETFGIIELPNAQNINLSIQNILGIL